MFASIVAIFITVLLACFACYLSFIVLRSKQALPVAMTPRFFLPSDFFVSLVLLGNYWLVILVLLGSQELAPADRPVIVVFTSLLAPFLSWWRKKKAGNE